MPAPTAWPIVLAFGVALLFAGLLTSVSVSIFGAILMVTGSVGWFRDVLPHEKHESIPVAEQDLPVTARLERVARVEWISKELPRARLPLEIYPISAGIKGGVAGGVAMAVLAILYGIVSGNGMWYPINLLSAGFFPQRTTRANGRVQLGPVRSCARPPRDRFFGGRHALRRDASHVPAPSHSAGRSHSLRFCGPACCTAFSRWSIR